MFFNCNDNALHNYEARRAWSLRARCLLRVTAGCLYEFPRSRAARGDGRSSLLTNPRAIKSTARWPLPARMNARTHACCTRAAWRGGASCSRTLLPRAPSLSRP